MREKWCVGRRRGRPICRPSWGRTAGSLDCAPVADRTHDLTFTPRARDSPPARRLSSSFLLYGVLFVRAMLKLHGMLEELREVYAMLGHPNEQKLCDLQERGAIVRDAVRVDSMYFRS